MGRKTQAHQLYVYMNGIHVGILAREYTNQLIFIYDKSWLSNEYSRPISLSMPLTEAPYKGDLVEHYFDNLLPDSRVIRERIQTRFQAPSEKCFDLLSEIGADCVGALQLLTNPQTTNIKEIKATPINDAEIAKLLKQYRTAPLGMDRNRDFRISIAGAQEKTALLWHNNQWNLPQGVTPTSHIIKLPIGKINHSNIDLTGSVENEWLCLKILAAYDMPVNNAEITVFQDVNTLVVERFDRHWSEDRTWLMRLPQEDMCQALGKSAANKYENEGGPGINEIMDILTGSVNAINDRRIFMKAVFLYWVIGAIDGHGKNFSISIEPKGRYKLTPLYDVISAYPLASKRQLEWKELKMAMSLNGKNIHYHWNEIQPRHWLETAKKCQLSERIMQEIIDETFENMETVISEVEKIIPVVFPKETSEPIFIGMRKLRDRFIIR